MTDTPEWALKMACEQSGIPWADYQHGPVAFNTRRSIEAHARTLAKYETPPVDPLLVEAREICARQYEGCGRHVMAKSFRSGGEDDNLHIQIALACLRRGAELRGEGVI